MQRHVTVRVDHVICLLENVMITEAALWDGLGITAKVRVVQTCVVTNFLQQHMCCIFKKNNSSVKDWV